MKFKRRHETVTAELKQPKKGDEHGPYYDVKWGKDHARHPRFIPQDEFERDFMEAE